MESQEIPNERARRALEKKAREFVVSMIASVVLLAVTLPWPFWVGAILGWSLFTKWGLAFLSGGPVLLYSALCAASAKVRFGLAPLESDWAQTWAFVLGFPTTLVAGSILIFEQSFAWASPFVCVSAISMLAAAVGPIFDWRTPTGRYGEDSAN